MASALRRIGSVVAIAGASALVAPAALADDPSPSASHTAGRAPKGAHGDEHPDAPPPPSGDATSEAATHFARGVALYEEADYPAALAEFTRAYALAPTWRVLFNVGQAHFQLHEYVEAHDALRRFLEGGGEQIKPQQRELARSELATLADRIGHVAVASNVTGASVSVDGRLIGTTPFPTAIAMSAGIRRVTATAAGRAPLDERVEVVGGDSISLRLDFASSPISSGATAPPPTALPDVPPASAHRAPNRVPAIASFGVAAAGAVLGGAFGALALDERATLDRNCLDKICPASQQSRIDALSRDAIVSDVGFGVAIAAAAVGVVLWFVAPAGTERANAGRRSWHFGPDGVGGAF